MDIEKDSNREAFEAWFAKSHYHKHLIENFWDTWQAAKVESHKQAALYQSEINHLAQANQQWREKAAKAQAALEIQQSKQAEIDDLKAQEQSHV